MIYEGLAYFNPHTTCQQVNQLMNATIQATIQTDRWKIGNFLLYCRWWQVLQ